MEKYCNWYQTGSKTVIMLDHVQAFTPANPHNEKCQVIFFGGWMLEFPASESQGIETALKNYRHTGA